MDRGVVCFVGLGPGDPGLLTARALDRLAQAEWIVREGEGEGTVEQAVARALEGKRVVRAVAFDPFESPRVREELRVVLDAGVAIEIVPGVGASAAAGAFAGVRGHLVRAAPDGVRAVLAGEPADAVVTLIADVGAPSQRLVVTTAAEAPGAAHDLGSAPVLVVLGAPDRALRWFERRPLFGKRVLVTRAREQAGSTAALLREHGADPVVVPTIAIRAPENQGPLVQAIAALRAGAYGWVAFTSVNGVERTWEGLSAQGGDARAFGVAKLAAVGPATAAALERHGLRADVMAKEFRGEGLAEAMLAAIASGPPSPRVLLARAARARDVLPEALRAAGCRVDVVAVYETHPPSGETVDALARALHGGSLDAATFTSSSTVDNFCDLLGERAPELLRRVRVASIGPVTTDAARARGVRIDVTAHEYTVSGLVQALAESYG